MTNGTERDKMKNKDDGFMFAADEFEVRLTAAHCRAARGWLGWSQAQLSKEAGVGLSTIKDYERGKRQTHKGVQLLLQNTFAKAGVWCSKAGIWHEDGIDEGETGPDDPEDMK
jgi:predicted transcriptional regulator